MKKTLEAIDTQLINSDNPFIGLKPKRKRRATKLPANYNIEDFLKAVSLVIHILFETIVLLMLFCLLWKETNSSIWIKLFILSSRLRLVALKAMERAVRIGLS